MQAGMDEEFIEQEARVWLNRCYICTMAGRDGDHELYSCRHPESHRAREWMKQVRSQVDYIPFRCCYLCGMPQSICHGWQAGVQCPWRGALIPMIASMLHGPQGVEVQAVWQQHLQGRMVEARVIFPHKPWRQTVAAHAVDIQDPPSVAAFLGQGTRDGRGVEMQAAFCWLRRVCQEQESICSA